MTDPTQNPEPPQRPETPEVHGAQGSARSRRGTRIGRGARGLHAFFTRELWSRELASLPTFRRWGYGIARVVHLTVVNFVKDRCSWRASALTYITVLSLVPMLAFAFSVAKGMGAYETLLQQNIVPFLDATFGPAERSDDDEVAAAGSEGANGEAEAPVGEATEGEATDGAALGGGSADEGAEASDPAAAPGAEVLAPDEAELTLDGEEPPRPKEVSEIRRGIDTVLGFVQDTNFSRLGVLGFLIVLYTVVKLLGSIEVSFNDIWGVQKSRSIPRKIADYFSTVILVPLLLVAGSGVLSIARTEAIDRFTGLGGDSPTVALLGSLLVVWFAFAFTYILMPNTRVRVTSALVGGAVGGSIWQMFQWLHLELQVGVANYNAIYSTFAALPIFFVWVQISWMTVLLGAEAAAAHQNQARHGQMVRSRDYDLALKEVVALRLAARVTRAFLAGEPPPRTDELAEALGCPDRTLKEITAALEEAHVLALVDAESEDPGLVLVSDPDLLRLQDVLDALKGDSLLDESREAYVARNDDDAAVDAAFGRFRETRDAAAANATLRQLATSGVLPGSSGTSAAAGASGRPANAAQRTAS
ncbi:MAG: YhjD/YihY/BrkB family envelope integrity protein [Planctomycetota bacterium]